MEKIFPFFFWWHLHIRLNMFPIENLPIEVKRVEKERSSLQIFLQKTNLKKKMQKVNEKHLGFKVNMQKITLQVKVN